SDTGRALRVHFVPQPGSGNHNDAKVVLRGRRSQREQVVCAVEMKRGLAVQFGHRQTQSRLQIVLRLLGGKGCSALIVPVADEKIATAGAHLDRVVRGHVLGAQPDLKPGNGWWIGGWNALLLTVLAGGEDQEKAP